MNEVYKNFNLNVISSFDQTYKVKVVKTTDGIYVIKLITDQENLAYRQISKSKYNNFKNLGETIVDGKRYFLYNYLETKDNEKLRAYNLLNELSKLHKSTKILLSPSKMDRFKFKKMIVIMNEKFNSIELKIREIETADIKNDNSWIVLSKYHIILEAKLTIYRLIKKISKEFESKELEYSIIHSYPTLEHFKGNRLISYSNVKKGYYVNDLYKAYIDLEYLDIDIKKLMEKYLTDDLAKRYFKLMVLYTYTLNLDIIDLKGFNYLQEYIFYTSKMAKTLSLFQDYK